MENDKLENIELDEQTSERRLIRARRSLAEAISENQSLLPFVGSVIGVLLALLMGQSEDALDLGRWTIAVSETRTGLISALSIVFAGLSIVLALGSVSAQNVVGRFSLRVVRIYQRNPADKIVIAVFAMAGTFILVEWFQLRALPPDSFAPAGGVLMGMLLLFLTGATIIWYIGAIINWLRVDRTVRRISRLTLHAARAVAREHAADSSVRKSVFERPPTATSILAARSGYLTEINIQGLLNLAVRYNTKFVIDRFLGRTVARGEPIGWMVSNGRTPMEQPPPDQISRMIELTKERELARSVDYGMIVLVDIAIMALSPAVNDPNTAVQVIEHMSLLFTELSHVRLGPVGRIGEDGRLRVGVKAPTFGDYVDLATRQIVLYGSEDPVVIGALLRFASVLEGLDLTEADRAAVDTFSSHVRGISKRFPNAG